MVAYLTCSILSRYALMPASLDIQPMRSCPELSNDTPEMLVAAILNVRFAAVSHFHVPEHLSLAGGSDCSCTTFAEHAACREYDCLDCRSGCASGLLPQETDEAE